MAKKRFKWGRIRGIGCLLGSAVLIYGIIMGFYRVADKKIEYNHLIEQRDALLKEKKQLAKKVEMLCDDDYVTRYARENYIFSKDGEEVVKLPEK